MTKEKLNYKIIKLYLYLATFSTIIIYIDSNYFDRIIYLLLNPVYLVIVLLPCFISYSYKEIFSIKNNYALVARFKNLNNAIKYTMMKVFKKTFLLFLEMLLVILILNNLMGDFTLNGFFLAAYVILRIFIVINLFNILNVICIFRFKKNVSVYLNFFLLFRIFYAFGSIPYLNYFLLRNHIFLPNNVDYKILIYDISYYFLIFIILIIINKKLTNKVNCYDQS